MTLTYFVVKLTDIERGITLEEFVPASTPIGDSHRITVVTYYVNVTLYPCVLDPHATLVRLLQCYVSDLLARLRRRETIAYN